VAADQGITLDAPAGPAPSDRRGKASAFLAPKRKTRLALLLSAPMLWLVVAYLGSLGVLFVSAFWTTDSFTGAVVHSYTLDNLRQIYTQSLYRTVAVRTISVALLVTALDALIAFPMAFYMSKGGVNPTMGELPCEGIRLAQLAGTARPAQLDDRRLHTGVWAHRHSHHADLSLAAVHGDSHLCRI
jgi:hypothetical protein